MGQGAGMRGCNTVNPAARVVSGVLVGHFGVKMTQGYGPFVSFCQEELHDLASGFGDAGAGAEDGGGACLVEEVVVLGGDYAAYYYHDILTAKLLEFLDYLRYKGLVTGGK